MFSFDVLIETQWNVKKCFIASSAPVKPCINRNIVECKVRCGCASGNRGTGINRNIVECKDRSSTARWQQHCVLIETQWNVKTDILFQMDSFKAVLIETQWNVKLNADKIKEIADKVLIETQWNVKSFCYRFVLPYLRINRNIVECKDSQKNCRRNLMNSINRNIVECKENCR